MSISTFGMWPQPPRRKDTDVCSACEARTPVMFMMPRGQLCARCVEVVQTQMPQVRDGQPLTIEERDPCDGKARKMTFRTEVQKLSKTKVEWLKQDIRMRLRNQVRPNLP